MRGLQRSPHVTTTMEFPAESTLVSILYLHSLSTRPVDLPSVQEGVLYLTVHHCTSLYCTAGRPSTVRHQGQPRQSVNSRLATSEECRDYSRD